VGTAARVAEVIAKHGQHTFHMVSNPEFLKEGAAVDDFMKPDRVVLGAETDHARSVMAELYAPFVRTGRPIIFMDIPSAEMTKYAANAMLATRISFMNEIANLCERVGANVDLVRRGIGSDERIGPSFLFPGPGYGGSCFPKDVKALAMTARDSGVSFDVLEAVEAVNARQKHRVGEKVIAALGSKVRGARVALWGLAFKANTDDMRDSPALTAIDDLLAAGADIIAHDPVAIPEARRRLGGRIKFAESSYEALRDADALAVITDWNEYRHPDFERMRTLLRRPVIVDGRNLYTPSKMQQLGFEYYSIGRGPDAAAAMSSKSPPAAATPVGSRR
jgi:UDPglucose 6-dehydrogenase